VGGTYSTQWTDEKYGQKFSRKALTVQCTSNTYKHMEGSHRNRLQVSGSGFL